MLDKEWNYFIYAQTFGYIYLCLKNTVRGNVFTSVRQILW